MYCSSCGKAVTPGLSFCNQCGAKLGRADGDGLSKSSQLRRDNLVATMAAVFIFGLGGIIGLLAALKFVFPERENMGLIIFFALLSFLIMLAVEGVFVWMLLGRKRGAKDAVNTKPFAEQGGNELSDAKARALPGP